jgi:HSP20 family protein
MDEKKTNQQVAKREENHFGFFDPLFDAFFPEEKTSSKLMKTDIKENENGYELTVDVPGFNKDQVNVKLNDGYLTISASESSSNDQQGKNGRYIRRERFTGSYERSFYVGDIEQKDIHAKLSNGVLTVNFPKESPKKNTVNSIAIE